MEGGWDGIGRVFIVMSQRLGMGLVLFVLGVVDRYSSWYYLSILGDTVLLLGNSEEDHMVGSF